MEQFENEKENKLRKVEKDALEKIEKAKYEASQIIEELRKLRRSATNVKEHQLIDAKTRMDEAIKSLSSETQKAPRTYKKKESREFKQGQEVKVSRFGQNGHIVEKINEHEYLVQIGIMKMNLAAADLKPLKQEQAVKPVVNVRTTSTAPARMELDLRGERFEEAMSRVDKFLDDALLAGYSRVSIIHGKGTGALRNGVKQKLKRHPRVKEARLGAYGEGDSGVTIVEFK